ncbi:LRR receptor-like serine/threonine-protein kinase EFR [Cryptomeria japonica]|uniref:LRR receptor-like serine/threonine-protein kinase EFR n=1 Tax=Cryptomeria japonica TaxID=3369 RepID=UPI0027DA33EB|nr:LRR receptor-like serine/threonine-protein kinase EFR [Cryptomeria japonica]
MIAHFFFIILVHLVLPFPVESSRSLHPHKTNASDEQALLAFKSAIEYDQLNSFATWTSNVSFCNWKGISCSHRRQRVVSLNLSTVGLVGTISPSLGNLSFLRILDLSRNNLRGHIPYELGNLSRLQNLYLYKNQLEGSIPAILGACHNIIELSLAANHLTGGIPSTLGFLPNLISIELYRNNLTGNIPKTLGNISSLKYIYLSENNLEGYIPWELGMLSQLSVLFLPLNHLTGGIPPSLSNCTSLQEMDFTVNYLSGEIPTKLFSRTIHLTELYMGANNFSGRIPVTLFNCSQLQILVLADNLLSGIVPSELGKLRRLTHLYLWGNRFTSGSTTSLPFLTALSNCSFVRVIECSHNLLTGLITSSVGQLSTNLEYLGLTGNMIIGDIPLQIGNLTNLTRLGLDGNLLTSEIPSAIGMLQRLERLYLGYNNLQGNIPMEIGQLKNLGLLALLYNNISGTIPDSLAHLDQIRVLYLQGNDLTGTIPSSLCECTKLELLDLSYNKLHGRIPPQVAGLSNLAIYFNLSNNFLEGPLPAELSKMDKVQTIDISANQLTGYIPDKIGDCVALEYLNFSFNKIEGGIPDSLEKLQDLRGLDFSYNNLTGRIPLALEKLKVLQHLNLSINKLSGEVPKDGVFKRLNATSFTANLALCGPWVMLPPCSAPKHKSLRHLKSVFIPIGTAVFVICCIVIFFSWRCYCKTRSKILKPFEVGPQKFSFQELLTATDGFNEANLLGVGSFGKVFRGALKDGTMVAIKVLNIIDEYARKSFDRECNVLRRVRHRNLLKIITAYSDPDMKALIFPLVANGSLDKFLYSAGEESSQGQPCRLDLTQRLSIALDVAQGMEYLHHRCFVQVIHCDLKPSNVLLGEDMTAYLIDFGISRLCLGNSTDSYTSTQALKGSIGYIAPGLSSDC